MIFLTFMCQLLSISAAQLIDKTIYLIEGEEYKVNLDSIFKEDKEKTYSFQSDNKGFTLDTSSLKLKSDQGTYSIKPTKIIRERQLINLEDYQGLGQFGILDQHDSGHRICYNSDAIITLDQCIELDNTATSYDFVFIDRNTIAVSQIRVDDQQFGVTIYQNKEIVSELFFVASKTYTQVKQTIIEYAIFGDKKYLLFGVTEEDSNIELLEIQDDLQIVNTNKVIDKSQLPKNSTVSTLDVFDIKGTQNKVFVVCNYEQAKLVISLKFQIQWIQQNYFISQEFRGLELGYSYIQYTVSETYLECQQDQYNIRSNNGAQISNKLERQISNAQVKYTLNYLIVLQDNVILVTTLQKSAQRINKIEGKLLKIDVDFQNDILIVFTDTKILTYYLKQATLSYSSNKITKNLDLVTIKAGEDYMANIRFQVLSKDDYNLYLLQDVTQELLYNLQSTQFSIPLYGISGGDIKVEGKVDDYIEISNQLPKYRLETNQKFKEPVILEQILNSSDSTYLFQQFDDFSYKVYECTFNIKSDYKCQIQMIQNLSQNQTVILQQAQVQQEKVKFALLNSDGLQVNIFDDTKMKLISINNQVVDMKVGIDRLFLYTFKDFIQFYYFTSGEFISQLDLSQFGQPKGEQIRKLWVNQAKTNLIAIAYGEEIIIGRFTTQFSFIQRITIKQVIDVSIIADNKFIILSSNKTTKLLTQYILEEGTIKIHRILDNHGYIITGDKILCDFVQEAIIIQAQKGSQKALFVFGNTELARDSLKKVINLQDDEFAENVVYNENKSSLLIRATDPKKNSTIIHLNYTHQGIACNLTKIPTQFSQQLDLNYIYGSQFSKTKIKTKNFIFLEYQFQNITVKQSSVITFESQLKIPINTDIFQGQVEKLYYKPEHEDIQLTTRFKNNKPFMKFDDLYECQQVVSFGRIICLLTSKIIYLNIDGSTLSSIKLDNIKQIGFYKQLILRDDGQCALIRTEQKMILVYISQDEIYLSQTFQDQIIAFDIYIFHKGWLIVYNNQLIYFKFQSSSNDSWFIEKQNEFQIIGIKAIQYDPITQQIFYITGDQNLNYFKSSLEGDTIDKQSEYSINLPQLLKSFKIHQVDPRIQYMKIIQQNKSYILISTSYGHVWNITISFTQDFKVNNLYIVGRSIKVYDIQMIEDYVLIQTFYNQLLYKNNYQSLDRPNLALEGIFAQQIIGLFKNGSQIIHICGYSRGVEIDINNIDDEVFLTIKNLNIDQVSVCAANDYQEEGCSNHQLVFQHNVENQSDIQKLIIIWIVASIIAIVYYFYLQRKQRLQPLMEEQENLEMVSK